MAFEVVITSAARGVKAGRTGFQVVACTRGIRDDLVTAIERQADYRHVHPAGSPRNPVIYGHRIISTAAGRFSVVSRMTDAGADFSSRSNKLAHFIAIDYADVAACRASSPAHVLLAMDASLVAQWGDRPPEFLPSRRIAPVPAVPGPCPTWTAMTGDPGWAGVLADRAIKGLPTTILHAESSPAASRQMLSLFAEAIALVPQSRRWHVTFETLATASSQAVWRGTYAGSPESSVRGSAEPGGWIDVTSPSRVPNFLDSPLIDAARGGKGFSRKPMILATPAQQSTGQPESLERAPPVPPPLRPICAAGPSAPTDGKEEKNGASRRQKRRADPRETIDDDSWEARVSHGRDPGRNRVGLLLGVACMLLFSLMGVGAWRRTAIMEWLEGLLPVHEPEPVAAVRGPAPPEPAEPDPVKVAFDAQLQRVGAKPDEPALPENELTLGSIGQKIQLTSLQPKLVGVKFFIEGQKLDGIKITLSPVADADGRYSIHVDGTEQAMLEYDANTGEVSCTPSPTIAPGLVRYLRRHARLKMSARPSQDETATQSIASVHFANHKTVDEKVNSDWRNIESAIKQRDNLPEAGVLSEGSEPVIKPDATASDQPTVRLANGDFSDLELGFCLPNGMPEGLPQAISNLRFTCEKRNTLGNLWEIYFHRENSTPDAAKNQLIASLKYDANGLGFDWDREGATDQDARWALAFTPIMFLPKNSSLSDPQWLNLSLVQPRQLPPIEINGLLKHSACTIPFDVPEGWLTHNEDNSVPTWICVDGLILEGVSADPKHLVFQHSSADVNGTAACVPWEYILSKDRGLTGRVQLRLHPSAETKEWQLSVSPEGWGDKLTRGLQIQRVTEIIKGPFVVTDQKLVGDPKNQRPKDYDRGEMTGLFVAALSDAGLVGGMPGRRDVLYTNALNDFFDGIKKEKARVRSNQTHNAPTDNDSPPNKKPSQPISERLTLSAFVEHLGEEAAPHDNVKPFSDVKELIQDHESDDTFLQQEQSALNKRLRGDPPHNRELFAAAFRWLRDMPAAKEKKDAIDQAFKGSSLKVQSLTLWIDWSSVPSTAANKAAGRAPLKVLLLRIQDQNRESRMP